MSGSSDGIIDVRTDEQLPLETLEPFLRAELPNATGVMHVRQFSGGHANLTYLISFGDTSYVLRRPPLGPVPPGAHDMARESRILTDLYKEFPLAPRSFVFCDDPEVMDAPFFVMEHRLGFSIQTDMPDPWQDDPDLNRRISEMLVDTLADFHKVSPDAVGLGDLGRPKGFAERQLSGWTKRWLNAEGAGYEGADDIITWLEAGLPEPLQTTLIHNDYKLNNLVVDHQDPAIPVAVVDWDMCTRGDPLFDLGYILNYWLEPDDKPEWREAASMPTWRSGFLSRREAIERYQTRTGFDVSRVDWYHVFGIFKLMGILQQIYIRYERGQTQDARFATFDRRIKGLIEKAQVLIASN